MKVFLLSFLFLSASTIVHVTSQCDFCADGITLPNYVLNETEGTTCTDVPNIDDPLCFLSFFYELLCCPGSSGFLDGCDFCPDGVAFPDAVVTSDGESITCTELVIGAQLINGTVCSSLIEIATPTCCTVPDSPASAISSMIAFVATAWIGCLVAF